MVTLQQSLLVGMNPHRDTHGDYLTWRHSTRPEGAQGDLVLLD